MRKSFDFFPEVTCIRGTVSIQGTNLNFCHHKQHTLIIQKRIILQMNDFMHFCSLKEDTIFSQTPVLLMTPLQFYSVFYLNQSSLFRVWTTHQCTSWVLGNSKSSCTSESRQYRRIQNLINNQMASSFTEYPREGKGSQHRKALFSFYLESVSFIALSGALC